MPNSQLGETTMRKLIIAAVAAASLLTAASAANAGYWIQTVYGPQYIVTCGYDSYGWYVCG
jgi:hypothetical protein